MLHSKAIAFCSDIHRKPINAVRRQDVQLLNVKPGGTYWNHWALGELITGNGKVVPVKKAGGWNVGTALLILKIGAICY